MKLKLEFKHMTPKCNVNKSLLFDQTRLHVLKVFKNLYSVKNY